MGYKTIAISSSSVKKNLALKLGAHMYLDESKDNVIEELQNLGGADVIVSTLPKAQEALNMLEGLTYEGKLLVLGLTAETATFLPGTSSFYPKCCPNSLIPATSSPAATESLVYPRLSVRYGERLRRHCRVCQYTWDQVYGGGFPVGESPGGIRSS